MTARVSILLHRSRESGLHTGRIFQMSSLFQMLYHVLHDPIEPLYRLNSRPIVELCLADFVSRQHFKLLQIGGLVALQLVARRVEVLRFRYRRIRDVILVPFERDGWDTILDVGRGRHNTEEPWILPRGESFEAGNTDSACRKIGMSGARVTYDFVRITSVWCQPS